MCEVLSARAGHRIAIGAPRRGEKKDLVEAALRNAREALSRKLAESATQEKLMAALGDAFGVDHPIRRIEVYDNSHIMGTNAIGAMVVAGPEGFVKNQYRTFNIKSLDLTPGDDYAMMREVLTRRFARLMRHGETAEAGHFPDTPDLVIIDGGRGQFEAARGRDRRAWRRGCAAGRDRQGSRPQRGARDLLHGGAGALQAQPPRPGFVLHPAPARRGASLRRSEPTARGARRNS